MDVRVKALMFAEDAHASIGQVRKYTAEPYIYHPMSVAAILGDYGFRDEVIAAAYLHDVLEDTPVTEEEMRKEFGDEITNLVLEVTDVSRPEDGNRAARKAKDREHLAKASPEGQSIKVADLIDNTRTITAHDPDFARVYLREKVELLGVLTSAHAALLGRAWDQIGEKS